MAIGTTEQKLATIEGKWKELMLQPPLPVLRIGTEMSDRWWGRVGSRIESILDRQQRAALAAEETAVMPVGIRQRARLRRGAA